MKEIGDTLKKKRQEKKFSLEYVNSQTHIPLKYICAMEEWTPSVFPAEVYMFGSLRRYARFLGLNEEELIEKYRRSIEETAGSLTPKEVKPSDVKKSSYLKISIFSILIILAGFFAWQGRVFIQPYFRPKVPRPSLLSKAAVSKIQTVTPERVPSETEVLKLEIKIIERAWVKVVADNEKAFEGILEPNTARQWVGKDKFYVSVGYVPGVRISLNGKPVDATVGANHDVNSFILTKNGVEPTEKKR